MPLLSTLGKIQRESGKTGSDQIFALPLFSALLQELTDETVLTLKKLMEGAIEDETAFFEHEEGGVGVGLAVGVRNHAAMLG